MSSFQINDINFNETKERLKNHTRDELIRIIMLEKFRYEGCRDRLQKINTESNNHENNKIILVNKQYVDNIWIGIFFPKKVAELPLLDYNCLQDSTYKK